MGKNLCVIPARLGSSRFPDKPMKDIGGMPMIGHVALRCLLEPVFDHVVVATCDDDIASYCRKIGVQAIMTSPRHKRATDRVEEATASIEAIQGSPYDSVTLVQGDEPMITPAMLRLSLQGLLASQAPITNLMARISSEQEFLSPHCVKVVTNVAKDALYFSRAPIPSLAREGGSLPVAYKQVCVISMTREFLGIYGRLAATYLEEVESVDMNRVLEHGYRLHCLETDEETYPVDTPEDLEKVSALLAKCPLVSRYGL